MKVAILSDIHDNLSQLEKALQLARDCAALICCGDICSPFTAKALAEMFKGHIHIVFGNNDGDRWRIAANQVKFPHLKFLGEFGEIELDGKRFAIHHFYDVGCALAMSARYDYVCCGHNHRSQIERMGKTLLLNPGELYGRLTGRSTIIILDTATDKADLIEIPQ